MADWAATHPLPPSWVAWQQPWIDPLLCHAQTPSGRQVVQRYFVTWEALDGENTRIWKTLYCPRALYEPWTTWRAWLQAQRTLLVITREVYEAHHGKGAQPCPP